jgi:hypothetical protein
VSLSLVTYIYYVYILPRPGNYLNESRDLARLEGAQFLNLISYLSTTEASYLPDFLLMTVESMQMIHEGLFFLFNCA